MDEQLTIFQIDSQFENLTKSKKEVLKTYYGLKIHLDRNFYFEDFKL